MKVFALLAFAGLVLADANSVNAGVQIINSATTQLGNDAKLYSGGNAGLPFALQVQLDALYVYKVVKAATADANSSPNFGEPGSFNIAATLLNTSQIVQTALGNIQAKAPVFADLQPLVLASLYQLKRNTVALGNAIVAKLAPVEKLAAPVVQQQILTAFNNAIVAYGGNPNTT